MKRLFGFILLLCVATIAVAETKQIMLVTPKGVYQTDVIDGVPGVWKPANVDVIVQGFNTGGNPNPPSPPDVPDSDPVVDQLVKIAKDKLKSEAEAVTLASLISALQKSNLSQKDFDEALELAIPIADSSLKADARLVLWHAAVERVSTDPAKLKLSLQLAFNVSVVTLSRVTDAAFANEPVSEANLELAKIIQIVQMIIDLLKTLGII